MSVLPPERGRVRLLLAISRLSGVGPSRTNAIISRLGVGDALFSADAATLAAIPGIGERLAETIAASFRSRDWLRRALEEADDQLDRTERLGATILTILDAGYPPLLREIYDPPPLLFVRGNHEALLRPTIAVVGTRHASPYGLEATANICRDLSRSGFTIISGLAYGIDMAAHRAALDNGGTTTAVLGCGIDNIYTDPTGKLWPRMLESGAIVSEEWIGCAPAPGNFPRRNRLISGLASGTLVVESDIRGGSMITAASAIEQNREVFAVPGSIFSKNSRGTNRLIQQCQAKPVHCAEDVIEELTPSGRSGDVACSSPGLGEKHAAPTLSGEESGIIDIIGQETLHIDHIAARSGIPVDALLVILFELELRHAVVQEAGQLFRRSRPGAR